MERKQERDAFGARDGLCTQLEVTVTPQDRPCTDFLSRLVDEPHWVVDARCSARTVRRAGCRQRPHLTVPTIARPRRSYPWCPAWTIPTTSGYSARTPLTMVDAEQVLADLYQRDLSPEELMLIYCGARGLWQRGQGSAIQCLDTSIVWLFG